MPKVGDRAWFYPAARGPGEQPWLAFIACVLGPLRVNLFIVDPNGQPFRAQGRGVRLLSENEPAPVGEAYCVLVPS